MIDPDFGWWRSWITGRGKHISAGCARLQELRVKAAGRPNRSIGDPQEIRKDGLAMFEALRAVRDRANATIDND